MFLKNLEVLSQDSGLIKLRTLLFRSKDEAYVDVGKKSRSLVSLLKVEFKNVLPNEFNV